VELAPNSANAWALRAYVQSYYILRTWDGSPKRRLDVQTYANRALALDPNQPEAMLALSMVLDAQGALPSAEAMLQRAIAVNPDDSRLWRRLARVLQGEGRVNEALAKGLETSRRFPRDPLAYYDLALLHMVKDNRADAEEALKYLNATLAIEYFPSAILNKTMILAGIRGDFAGAQKVLDTLEPADRTTDRAVSFAMWLGLLQHQPDRVGAAAALTAEPYFAMPISAGPSR
jgi:Flp pilus assembly protein TadD